MNGLNTTAKIALAVYCIMLIMAVAYETTPEVFSADWLKSIFSFMVAWHQAGGNMPPSINNTIETWAYSKVEK